MKQQPLSREAELCLAHRLHDLKQRSELCADRTVEALGRLLAGQRHEPHTDRAYDLEGALILQRVINRELIDLTDDVLLEFRTHRQAAEFDPLADLNLPGHRLPLHVRTSLHDMGVGTLTDLSRYTQRELLTVRGISERRLRQIKDALTQQGLTLHEGHVHAK